jgi:BASS family bile acid:Na+ symporter
MTAALEQMVMLLLLVFMVGSLLGLGLDLVLRDAVGALRHGRFVLVVLAWGFLLAPALAFVLARAIPMAPPYAMGLLLLGMAPCAPFVPLMVRKAQGDLSYAGAAMLLSAVGTVLFMPLAVPVMVEGLSADPWMIGRPLLYYVLAPLAAGLAVRARAPRFAAAIGPIVRRITNLATVLMLLGMSVVYGADMIGAIGSYAIGAQVLYFAALLAGSYWLAPGLAHGQRSVLSLSIGTRNIGAALAPLVAIDGIDPRAIVMCVIATVITVGLAGLAAGRLARGAGAGTAPSGAT